MLVTALVVDVDTLVALVQVQTKFIIGVVVARNITTTGDDLVAVASVVHELKPVEQKRNLTEISPLQTRTHG